MTAGGWFLFPLAVFAFYWPFVPDGASVKWFAVGLTALLAVNVRRLDGIDWLAVSVPVWAFVSASWATDPWGVVPPTIHIAALVFVFMAARRLRDLDPFLIAAAFGLCAVFLSAVLHPEYQGGFGNENFTTMFVIAAMPAAFALGGWARIVVVVITIYLLSENGSRLELPAVAGWMACWFLMTPWTKRKVLTLCALTAGFAVVALVMLHRDTSGWPYRVDMWQTAVLMFWDSPLLGHGLGGFDTDFLRFAPEGQIVVRGTVYAPGSAHGDFLQVVAEFGAVGAAWLLLSFALPLWRRSAGRPTWPWYSLSGIAACALVDAPFQLPATALIAAVALGALLPATRARGALMPLLSVIAVCGLLYAMGAALWSQRAFAQGLAEYKDRPYLAHFWMKQAIDRWPYDKRARFSYVFAAVRSGVDEDGLKRSRAAAESAYPGHPYIAREFK